MTQSEKSIRTIHLSLYTDPLEGFGGWLADVWVCCFGDFGDRETYVSLQALHTPASLVTHSLTEAARHCASPFRPAKALGEDPIDASACRADT